MSTAAFYFGWIRSDVHLTGSSPRAASRHSHPSVAETDAIDCYELGRSWCPVHYAAGALYQDASCRLHSILHSSSGLGPARRCSCERRPLRALWSQCIRSSLLCFHFRSVALSVLALFLVERMNKLHRADRDTQAQFSSLFHAFAWINCVVGGFRFKRLTDAF